jgi:hypothetical protein
MVVVFVLIGRLERARKVANRVVGRIRYEDLSGLTPSVDCVTDAQLWKHCISGQT